MDRNAPRRPSMTLLALFAAGGVLLLLSGCAEHEEITTYTVPKPEVVYEANHVDRAGNGSRPAREERPRRPAAPERAREKVKARTIAAIIPEGRMTWFFKLTGPPDAVGEQMESFTELVKSLEFEGSKPKWSLPEEWRQRGASGMRFATVEIDSDGAPKPLELTVIPLGISGSDYDEWVLINVNRWRGELGLPDVTKDRLYDARSEDAETRKIELNGKPVVLVNLTGEAAPELLMGRPPFASNRRAPARPSAPVAARSAGFDYKAPDGWSPAANDRFSKAAFEVEEDDRKVRITVTSFGGPAGDLFLNVNRWREQIGLAPIGRDEIDSLVKPIEVGEARGSYVELTGPEAAGGRQTLLGAIVPAGGQTWFFKLTGDAGLAAREKGRFETFLQSVTFGGE